MTLNIISDLHCSMNDLTKKVIWNRSEEDQQYFNTLINKRYIEMSNIISEIRSKYDSLKDIEPQIDKKSMLYTFNPKIASIKNLDQCIKLMEKVHLFYSYPRKYYYDGIVFDMDKIAFFLDSISFPFAKYSFQNLMYKVQSEFRPEKLKKADYLLIAGDLGLNESYEEVYKDIKKRTRRKFKDVFYIKGNHDYWKFGKDRYENIDIGSRFIEAELDENTILLGCTLWSPIPENEKWCVRRGMNDYNYIPFFTPEKSTELYNRESSWLRDRVRAHSGKKIIIMTHHLPREEIIDDRFMHSDVNSAYCVMNHSCDDIKPLVWVHGHSHNYSDHTIDGVRYIRNPIGYREHYGYVPSECPTTHWYNTIIEV